MPMSPRLLRPIASGLHPEAQVWRNAVIANSGTVSASTVKAVSDFCKSIDSAGIRNRFYRLNLFAGTGLSACLVPLYRGPSRAGSQFGNTTDTNVNFASGDYSESDGLLGATSPAKYLRTGLAPNDVGVSTGHFSMVAKGAASSGPGMAMGSRTSGATQRYEMLTATVAALAGGVVTDFSTRGTWGGTAATAYTQTGDPTRPAGQYLFSRTSNTRTDFYINGTSVANVTTSLTPGANANEFYVHAVNNNGSPFFTGATTMRGYSLGGSLDSAQAAAYSAAFSALNTALGRT